MPLTAKGSEIKSALVKEYGEKKGEQVFYAGKNKGTFTGIDAFPTAEHGLLSPSGHMSERARSAALERERVKLFGPGGLKKEPVKQSSEKESLLRQAKELRDLAARGMRPKAYQKKASELEQKASLLDAMLDSIAKLDAASWNSVAQAKEKRSGLGAERAKERAHQERERERAERQRVRSLPEGPEKYSPENVQAFLKSFDPPKWVQKHIKKSIGDAMRSMCDSVDRLKAACDDRRVIGGVGNKMTAMEIKVVKD